MWPCTGKRTLTTFCSYTGFHLQLFVSRSTKICTRSKGFGHPFGKKIHSFEQLGRPCAENTNSFERLDRPFAGNTDSFKRLGRSFAGNTTHSNDLVVRLLETPTYPLVEHLKQSVKRVRSRSGKNQAYVPIMSSAHSKKFYTCSRSYTVPVLWQWSCRLKRSICRPIGQTKFYFDRCSWTQAIKNVSFPSFPFGEKIHLFERLGCPFAGNTDSFERVLKCFENVLIFFTLKISDFCERRTIKVLIG